MAKKSKGKITDSEDKIVVGLYLLFEVWGVYRMWPTLVDFWDSNGLTVFAKVIMWYALLYAIPIFIICKLIRRKIRKYEEGVGFVRRMD